MQLVSDDTITPQKKRPTGIDLLTKREEQVADLVAEGLTNEGIASGLMIPQGAV